MPRPFWFDAFAPSNSPLLNQPKPLQTDPYLALDNVRVAGQLQLEF